MSDEPRDPAAEAAARIFSAIRSLDGQVARGDAVAVARAYLALTAAHKAMLDELDAAAMRGRELSARIVGLEGELIAM